MPFPRRLLFGSRANNAAKNDRLSLGRPVAYTLPGGQQVTYHYNDTGRLAALHLDGKPVLNDIRYDSLGRMTHATWGNGLARRADYDRHGRLHKHQRGPDTITYAYDPAGNLTAQNDERYHYDALDRLTGAEHTVAGTLAYAYDANGNRTAQTVNGQTMPYHIQPGSNRLIQAGDEVLHYDAAGSLVEDGRFAYHYNARGRLERVVDKSRDREIARYRYNALGLRTAKTVAGETTYYTYAPNGMLVAESGTNGKLLKQYLWLGITPIAVLDHTNGAPVLHYLHTDHLGTPRSATNAAGNITWRWRSTPFGEGAPEENRLALNLRFPGQYYDSETGLHYNYFRHYDPATGRYTTSDPIGLLGGLNTYSYVNNTPLSRLDIHGLIEQEFGLFDDVTEYIFDQMMFNLSSPELAAIRTLMAMDKYAGYMAFASKVGPGGEWDHKKVIYSGKMNKSQIAYGKRYSFDTEEKVRHATWFVDCAASANNATYYNFDIWSNIHYGFIGMASGIPEEDLLNFAGLAQTTSLDTLPSAIARFIDDPGMASLDDPNDQAAIALGISLYQNGITDLQAFHQWTRSWEGLNVQ